MQAIVFGSDCTNSLGIVQCLGMEGINVSALIFGTKTGLVESSRFARKVFYEEELERCIDVLLHADFSSASSIPIIASSDMSASELIRHKEELTPKYCFEYVKSNSQYTYAQLLDKHIQLQLAKEAGVRVPELYAELCVAGVTPPSQK